MARLTLLENAIHSLEHGIDHLDGALRRDVRFPPDSKFALLHLAHACDLLCKEYVRRLNEDLLFVGKAKGQRRKTIGFDRARALLKRDKVLEKSDDQMLRNLDFHRDEVMHFEFDLGEERIGTILGQAMEWAVRFADKHLQINLQETLLPAIWLRVRDLVRTYEELKDAAQKSVDEKFPLAWDKDHREEAELFYCDQCGETFRDRDGHCHFCEDGWPLGNCWRCGTELTPDDSDGSCSYCTHVMTRDE